MEVSGAAGIEADGKEKEADDEKVEREDGVVGRVVEDDAGAAVVGLAEVDGEVVVVEGMVVVGFAALDVGVVVVVGVVVGTVVDGVVAGVLVSVAAAVVVPVVVGALNDTLDIVGQNVRAPTKERRVIDRFGSRSL